MSKRLHEGEGTLPMKKAPLMDADDESRIVHFAVYVEEKNDDDDVEEYDPQKPGWASKYKKAAVAQANNELKKNAQQTNLNVIAAFNLVKKVREGLIDGC